MGVIKINSGGTWKEAVYKTTTSCTCSGRCSGGCTGCYGCGSCSSGCYGGCLGCSGCGSCDNGCYYSCSGGCDSSCSTYCRNSCKGGCGTSCSGTTRNGGSCTSGCLLLCTSSCDSYTDTSSYSYYGPNPYGTRGTQTLYSTANSGSATYTYGTTTVTKVGLKPNISGTWRSASNVKLGVGGSWKTMV